MPIAVHAHHVRKVDDAAVTFGDDDVVMSDGADRNGLDVAEGVEGIAHRAEPVEDAAAHGRVPHRLGLVHDVP